MDLLERHYEGAATGRRTQNWRSAATDANTAIDPRRAMRATAQDREAAALMGVDMNQTIEDFRETCRRFTFGDFYDHCPASLKVSRDLERTNLVKYRIWLFGIDLPAWTITRMTDQLYAEKQRSLNSLERWVAVFSDPTPAPQAIAYLSRYCWLNCQLPYTSPFLFDEGGGSAK
jgi:hypothetical protein